jgi:hypothetical protein
LRRKIAALESLAENPGTTVAESEAAQHTANKMRLELSQLLRSGAGVNGPDVVDPAVDEGFETDTPRSAPGAPADGADVDAAARPDEDANAPRRARRRRRSPVETERRTWLWSLPIVGVLAIAGAWFWKQPHGAAEPSAGAAAAAPLGAPRPLGADAMLACKTRDLVREFKSTSGGRLLPGEGEVDLRRRCSAYLNVRGVDDGMCFPASSQNRHPVCPLPD